MKRRLVIVVIALLAFGAAKLPFEEALEAQHRAAFFRGARLDLSLREQIGQMGFIAALSGFRSLVADALYIHAHAAWERTEWGRMKLDFDAVTALQPRCLLFWDQASWHMAFNASIAAYQNPKQPREALRLKAQREYWKLGEEYLLRGIANNPDKPLLYDRLGFLYREKFQDHCKAAEAYRQCALLPRAPQYAHRFYAYELAQCPGHEREAYDLLLKLYKQGEDERLPTLLRWLGTLQEKLNVPADQKVDTSPPVTP
jgi:hypothetical protein